MPLPAPRDKAPAFEAEAVVDGKFKTVNLDDFKGKYFVLFFYPADFTFVCPTEICAFSDRVEEFRKIGCEVAAVSTDTKFVHLAWTKQARTDGGLGPMNIPLIADQTQKISRDYGVLIEDGSGDHGLTYRGLFVINEKGVIKSVTVNDTPVGRNVDEVLRLVQAFQFNDKHGEVCPINWKPGAATMKDDPWESKKYFSTLKE